MYLAPVCLRLRYDPMLATVVMTGVFSTWKSYPTLGDLAVWAGLLGCFPEIITSEVKARRCADFRSSPSLVYLDCIPIHFDSVASPPLAMAVDRHG